jgi:hypothetical protein
MDLIISITVTMVFVCKDSCNFSIFLKNAPKNYCGCRPSGQFSSERDLRDNNTVMEEHFLNSAHGSWSHESNEL